MADAARLLLTRPMPAARRFLAACEAARGAPIRAILSPVLAIAPVEVTFAHRPGALVLTSENGAQRAGELGLGNLPAWCVGPRTAAVARSRGLYAIEAGPDVEGLLKVLLAVRPEGLLHLRGEHARGDLVARLRAEGIEAIEVVAYRQDALPPTAEAREALDGPAPLVVPIFSPRSAGLLAAWGARAPLRIVAMSPAVVEAALALRPKDLHLAERPDGVAMVAATLRALSAEADGIKPQAVRLEPGGPSD